MNVGHLQIGFHGCDVTVRDGLVSGRMRPAPSNNQYDWLGPGFYLFEGDHERALAFAETAAQEPLRRLTAKPIATPAVVGCIFQVQRCLDMTTRAGRLEFENAYLHLQAARYRTHQRIPMNVPTGPLDEDVLLRGLDRAVFQFIHSTFLASVGSSYFQAVRGAFRQGPELLPGSGFHMDSHLQIALTDMGCIKGWFLPPGAEQLSTEDLYKAHAALSALRRANAKPRLRC